MFVCTANSCRSQMAEGLARHLGKGRIEVFSAGLMAAGVHERAMAVMKEIGIDISGQRSKEIDPAVLEQMDVVITLCSSAERYCPAVPASVRRLHWPIEDPVGVIRQPGVSEQDVMDEFRRARDEIKTRIMRFLEEKDPPPIKDKDKID